MTTEKTKRWVLVDAPVERLLDEIGVPDLEYYSAGAERAVTQALDAWPLLAEVAHALRAERKPEIPPNAPEQSLRVVDPDAEPGWPGPSAPPVVAPSGRKEAG
jgi:hypothetical protein